MNMNNCLNPNVLRKLHLTELEIMCVVDKVCRDHNLEYYLVGGTLLGAERHQGFIPWDDDLDIAMPRKDYNRFIELCNAGCLGDKYFLQHTSSYPDYFMPFAKVRKNNTLFDEEILKNVNCHKGIFIDVFPLDYSITNKGIMYHLRAKTIKYISSIILLRTFNQSPKNIASKILYFFSKMFSISQIANYRDAICMKYNNGKYLINYGSNYNYSKQTMEKEIYFPGVDIEFEGHMFRAPAKHVDYLVNLFGDWQKLQKKKKRRNHNPTTVIFDTTSEVIEE